VRLGDRLVALVVADQHSPNERLRRGALVWACEQIHDLGANLVEEMTNRTNDLAKQASVPRAALAVAPKSQHEGRNLTISTASIGCVRYRPHARRRQRQRVGIASENGVADIKTSGLGHLQRRAARSRLPAHSLGRWLPFGSVEYGEVLAFADADDPP